MIWMGRANKWIKEACGVCQSYLEYTEKSTKSR